jgi:hypothetical protein
MTRYFSNSLSAKALAISAVTLPGWSRRSRSLNWRNASSFAGGALVFVEPPQVEFHLADVGGLEGLQLQLDGDESTEVPVEEEEIQVKVVFADTDPFLPGNEGESGTELQKDTLNFPQNRGFKVPFAVGTFESEQIEKVGIAEHGIRRQAAFAQVADLGGDDGLGLF